jgi:SAM-dependent methyltransferase
MTKATLTTDSQPVTRASSPHAGFLAALACPACHGKVQPAAGGVLCDSCRAHYPIVQGIYDMVPAGATAKAEEQDWSAHWSEDKQESLAQRFFSFYRKAVFARTVRFFLHRYFPPQGLFVEAGSGTSETSMLVDKREGRVLVALDLILPVLTRCHPVMDLRTRGDIFRLPFHDNSIDGIWNVGVMEHFTHDRIDQILREFKRVLRPGGRVILLWPAKFSIPQRMLRCVEWFVNLRRRETRFQFHPDEISQLGSIREGKYVLSRNGFRVLAVDPGLYSLMAFETLVGEK